jgi:NitT/TauT family transport system substrate-binding protein
MQINTSKSAGCSSRRYQSVFAALFGVAVAAVCSATSPSAQQAGGEKLRVSLSHPPIMPHTNAIIASRKGIFASAGLDVERKVLGSADIIRSALTSGDIDVVGLPTDAVVRARLAGLDWRFLGIADIYDDSTADAAIVVRADSDIKTAKDLEDKTVAIIPGNLSEVTFKAWVREGGADIKKIKMVAIPYAQVLGALQSKQIDATHIVEPFLTSGIEKGITRILVTHLKMVLPRYMISGYIATASWIEKNPEKANRFADAITASNKFVLEHPDEALTMLAAETRMDTDLLKKFFPQHYVIAPTIRAVEIQSVIDFLAKEKIIAQGFSHKEINSPYMPVKD